jgi:hypothetical protein
VETNMGAAAAVLLRRERDIVGTYRSVGATSPDRARRPEELDVGQRLAFRRLVQRSVLREAGEGSYYLDEPSWEALGVLRRRFALVIAIVLVGALVILMAGGVVTFRGH